MGIAPRRVDGRMPEQRRDLNGEEQMRIVPVRPQPRQAPNEQRPRQADEGHHPALLPLAAADVQHAPAQVHVIPPQSQLIDAQAGVVQKAGDRLRVRVRAALEEQLHLSGLEVAWQRVRPAGRLDARGPVARRKLAVEGKSEEGANRVDRGSAHGGDPPGPRSGRRGETATARAPGTPSST